MPTHISETVTGYSITPSITHPTREVCCYHNLDTLALSSPQPVPQQSVAVETIKQVVEAIEAAKEAEEAEAAAS